MQQPEKPWAVFWKERPQDKYQQIGAYPDRYQAEDHAAHVLTKVQGYARVAWIGNQQVA